MLARPVIFESVTFSDPVLPSTCKSAPCQVNNPAKVTTNDGTTNLLKRKPWANPIAAPTATAAAIARYGFQPCLTFKTTITAPARPDTAPTERSISPSSNT